MKAVKLHDRVLHIADDEDKAQNWIDCRVCATGMIYLFYRGQSMPVSPDELVIVDYADDTCHSCGAFEVRDGICPKCLFRYSDAEAWEYGIISRRARLDW